MTRLSTLRASAALPFVLPFVVLASLAAQKPSEGDASTLALGGHDPVSYFEAHGGAPRPGDARFSATQGDATYRFASAANQKLFEADPAHFVPLFAGHDPLALAAGKHTPGDPLVYSIVGDRLFVFADADARQTFLGSFDAAFARAAATWKKETGVDLAAELRNALARDTSKYVVTTTTKPAIEGADPVSYFPEGGGGYAKGSKKLAFTFRGATYWFANEANRTRFLTNPTRYEPAFGGWCAYAISKDGYTEPNVKKFEIDERGRLLLFYTSFFVDTHKSWHKEGPEDLIVAADRFWTRETGETARRAIEVRVEKDAESNAPASSRESGRKSGPTSRPSRR
jgi:YHS domain-containing protein